MIEHLESTLASLTITDTSGGGSSGGGDEGGEPPAFSCGESVSYEGQDYATVEIGTQCWFAENLNVGTEINGSTDQTDNGTMEKWCYANTTTNCDTYGGLYDWNEMMNYDSTEGGQGICPTGWHVATNADWQTLISSTEVHNSGTAIIAGGSSGVNIKLAGFANNGSFNQLSVRGFYWTSSGNADYLIDSSAIVSDHDDVSLGMSVRCIQDAS